MKKLLGVSTAKMLIFCGIGLLLTIGSFWHYQMNQAQLDRMNVLNQGVSTCFNRISQTFTALMIKEVNSPYLNRGFMSLSDECLNETIKGINPFRQNVGKGYETLNKLISDVHWFHEKVIRAHSPMLADKAALSASLAPISETFTNMESLKVNLVDEIDAASVRLRAVLASDEMLMGSGLLIFVISIGFFALKEFNRQQLMKEIEANALNLLKSGQADVGALVDQIVDRGLRTQGLPVTAQIFRDYHGELLERNASRPMTTTKKQDRKPAIIEEAPVEVSSFRAPKEVIADETLPKTSFKEVLVSIQNINPKDSIHASDVRDAQLAVNFESFEQLLNAAVNKLLSRRFDNKKVMISNQIHSDKVMINLFIGGAAFTASELEFAQNHKGVSDQADMNLILLKEMANETNTSWNIENKTDKNGSITGMSIRLTAARVPKDRSKLVSVVRGKKKDLAQLMN